MYYINIEVKVKEIKRCIGIYSKESFVGFFADFIRHNPIRSYGGFTFNLKSKLKDSLYLIGLRLSMSDNGTEEFIINDKNLKVLEKVSELLLDIVTYYLSENQSEFDFLNIEKIKKHTVHEYTFANYFQNGILNYREQEINHIYRLFEPYRELIKNRLKIDYHTLIDMCNFSEEFYKKKSIDNQSFLEDKNFKKLVFNLKKGDCSNIEFVKKIQELNVETSNSFFAFFDKPHDSLIFRKEDYLSNFSKNEVDIYCELFSIDINENLNVFNYSDNNPLELKPIIKINDIEYLNVFQKQLPNSIYKLLYNTVGMKENEKTKLSNRKGKIVFEKHVTNVFELFFKKSNFFKVYNNYYIQGTEDEKDILILANNYAFIIECKTSKLREPTDITNQAFQRISSDFKDCIQKGFNQCIDVENKLLNNESVVIEVNKRKEKVIIDVTKLIDIYSIVVTSDRLGIIQTNLNLLLVKKDEDLFPWSISIDDLEIFLTTLKITTNNPFQKIINFLELREKLHGKIFCNDELDICALYLNNSYEFKKIVESNIMFEPDPKMQNFFDKLYFSKKLNFKIFNDF